MLKNKKYVYVEQDELLKEGFDIDRININLSQAQLNIYPLPQIATIICMFFKSKTRYVISVEF